MNGNRNKREKNTYGKYPQFKHTTFASSCPNTLVHTVYFLSLIHECLKVPFPDKTG